jgi:hypothetical protein
MSHENQETRKEQLVTKASGTTGICWIYTRYPEGPLPLEGVPFYQRLGLGGDWDIPLIG